MLVVLTVGALIILPCIGLFGGIGYFALERAGTLSVWKSLGAPPYLPSEILASDTHTVYVATQEGRIYGCQHRSRQARCWFAVDRLPDLDRHVQQNASESVFEGKAPSPGVVVNQRQVTRWQAEFAEETHYALLADGTVWKWEYSRGGLYGLFGNMLIGLIIGVIIAVFSVIVVWLIVAVVAIFRAIRRAGRALP